MITKKTKIDSVQIMELPRIQDPRGNLTFIQYPTHIPFPISRVFFTYDVPGGEVRGGHAYYKQKELIIALSGSFDVVVKLGKQEKRFQLNRSYYGLYLPPLTWRHMDNFSTNSLSLHIVDSKYDKSDYIRDFEDYKKLYYEKYNSK